MECSMASRREEEMGGGSPAKMRLSDPGATRTHRWSTASTSRSRSSRLISGPTWTATCQSLRASPTVAGETPAGKTQAVGEADVYEALRALSYKVRPRLKGGGAWCRNAAPILTVDATRAEILKMI